MTTPSRKSAAKIPPPRPQANVMLSRVAHSLYWMSRFIERAENIARLLEVNLQFILDFRGYNDAHLREHWGSILASSGDQDLFDKHYESADSRSVTEFFAFDLRNTNSILSCVFAARENARMIRDQISVEMWETINELYLFLKSRNTSDVWAAGPYEFFQEIKRNSHLFQGLTDSTYSRSEGWEFIQFGKFVERANKTARILDVKYHILLPSAGDVGGAVDTAQWQAVLRSASALEAYRKFYVREILPWKVAEFLIFSDSFPRSIHFCVAQIDDFLRRILGESGTRPRTEAARASRRLLANLQSLTIDEVLKEGLHEFLVEIGISLEKMSEEVVQTTMFYVAESTQEEQQLQQQQLRAAPLGDLPPAAMLISLLHRTTFVYAGKAQDSFNEVRLRPLDDATQVCRSFELRTDPATQIRDYVDFYGNTVHYFDIVSGHEKLVIEAVSEVETTPNSARPPVPVVPPADVDLERELRAEFLVDSHYVPLDVTVWKEAQDALEGGRSDLWSDVRRICRHVYTTFAYKPRSTGVATVATDAIKQRAGVCQDFAHVSLGMCRTQGIPVRYVSGYFIQVQRRPGEDEASHAWIEAFVPGYGWAAYDPTHDRPADERYVKVASGRDYGDIRPVSGTYRGGKTRSLQVEVRLRQTETAGATR